MADGTLRVAAVQMTSRAHLRENLDACGVLVERARAQGAAMIVLPENFAYFGPDDGRRAIAERFGDGGPIETELVRWSTATNAFIVAGGMPEASNHSERPYNTCAVFGPDGRLAARYRK